MKCPYCSKEMEAGFIQCRDGVYWAPTKKLVAALACLSKGRQSLANGAADNATAVHAYKCSDCMKVIIDYSAE